MKKTIGTLAISATLGLSAMLFANVMELKAQTPAPSQTPAPAAAQGQCTAENKTAWYTEFRQIFKIAEKQAKAYDLAQKYLACPAEAGEESIRNYLQNTFVAAMDKARRTPKITDLVYDKKDYAAAFTLGKQVLTDEPDNVKVLVDLAYAGFAASSKNIETFNADSLTYAKKAIQLLEAGTVPESWAPYTGKDEALSYLNNTIGFITLQKDPSAALPYLLKAAKFEGKLKKQPITYGYIGDAYQAGPYAKLSADYKAKFEKQDETPESKLALENINQVIDRMVDAYARAVSLSGADAALQASKTAWMETLTTWYKYRHGGVVTGLPELIASVVATPLPPEPTPITTLPTATPAATPTTSASPTPGSVNTVSSTAMPTSTVSSVTNKATTTAAVPAATTGTMAKTPATASTVKPAAKPKTRNNHRRH